jgi:hypothetical protein
MTARDIRELADRCWAARRDVVHGSAMDHVLRDAADALHELARDRERIERDYPPKPQNP